MDAFKQNNNSPLRLPPNLSPAASQLTPADDDLPPRRPTLLPAFEPLSSSPLPSKKRRFEEEAQGPAYPTPVPTSSTGILALSSPRPAITRPALVRTASVLSERTPFSDIPTVAIPETGEQLLLGRSSKACHFQLPYNSLISRVHVAVTYEPPSTNVKRAIGRAIGEETPENASTSASGRVLIECFGWNGCNVRCKGRVNALSKGDVFVASEPVKEIMLDVMDLRVILTWPESEPALRSPQHMSGNHVQNWVENSPTRRLGRVRAIDVPIASSPPQLHLQSPVSPSLSPAARRAARTLPSPSAEQVHVYEDPASDANSSPSKPQLPGSKRLSNATKTEEESNVSGEENENEENEPMVHSLGPYGSNILSRFTAIATTSPERPMKRRKTLDGKAVSSPIPAIRKSSSVSPGKHMQSIEPPAEFVQPSTFKHPKESPIKNHVINQLAFSRIHSTPISTIYGNLPADLKGLKSVGTKNQDSNESEQVEPLTKAVLTAMIHSIPCVGEISREGKDAAGKQLENEFYYIPDRDENAMRRVTVTSGKGSTGLRAVRKNHKQYFWKRPRN